MFTSGGCRRRSRSIRSASGVLQIVNCKMKSENEKLINYYNRDTAVERVRWEMVLYYNISRLAQISVIF
jgi:hypothetical protein